MLAAEIVNPLHNYAMPMDVNEDGAVSAADALAVINSLHQGLVAPKSVPDQSLANLLRTDTNNDGQVSALDALLVINSLHSFSVSPSSQAASAESTATIFVTTTSDSGPGSLRQAILAANASTTDTTIGFAIPTTDLGYVDVDSTLAGGDANPDVFRISPSSPLPEIQNVNGSAITIDGVSQTTFGGNTNPFGPEVELAGTAAGGSHGLSLRSSRVTVNGLAINGFSFDGISVRGSQATILGSYIGTDATGTLNRGNGDNGIRLHDTANTTTIGGATLDAANVISGNAGHGIGIAATNTFIYGNKIGTTADGSTALGNMRDGINSNNSTGITIGGPAIGERNVISANALAGVFLQLAPTTETTIVNNYIGTDGTGTVSLGTQGIGVRFENSVNLVVDNNLISGNTFAGIAGTNTDTLTVQRNRVGTSADGNSAVPNGVHGIEIFRGKNTLIGGPNASHGNVVSGQSQVGIRALGLHDGLVVQNNHVGTNTSGDVAIANGSGISVDVTDSSNVVISRNLVSGNSGGAMTVFGAPLNEAIVELNRIGTNAAGTDILANDSNGLFLQFTNNVSVRNNVVVGSKFNQGIEVDRSRDISITDNNVGVALNGITAMPNAGRGIDIFRSYNIDVERNIISGNLSAGVYISETVFDPNVVQWTAASGGNDHWYWIPPDQRDWHSHVALATTVGGNLATINVANENEFIRTTLLPQINEVAAWIGYSDFQTEGSYVWSSGETPDYTNWSPGEPNGGTFESAL